LLLVEQVPIDRLEEGMFLEFGSVPLGTESVLGVSIQEL
jgi:hypothetical protein